MLRTNRGQSLATMIVALAAMILAIGMPQGGAAQPLFDPDEPSDLAFSLEFGRLSLEPLALVQLQGVPWVEDESDVFFASGDVAEQTGFRVRRARFGFRGTLYDIVSFAVSTELASNNDGTAELLDAWIGYHNWKYAQLIAGAHNVPFSRSNLEGAGNQALIERSFLVRSLAPGRQVGLQVFGEVAEGAFGYHFGVYNGFQRGDSFYAGYQQNSAVRGNRFDDVALAARLTSEPAGSLGGSIQDLRESEPRIGLGASYFFSDGGARDIHAIGADFLLHAMGFHLLTEFIWTQTQPEDQPTQETFLVSDVTSLGFTVEAGYTIIRRIGLHARFEWIDTNTDIEDNSDSWVAAAGVSYHFIENALKVNVDYIHREERFGEALGNDALVFQIGLNLGGLP